MTGDDPRLTSGIHNLLAEYTRSVQIHTAWEEYDEHECYTAVEDEYLEFRRAVITDNNHGPHSKKVEALQLAVVALKAHIFYSQGV